MKNQKKQGFTLVEIMIVVMIIGLLAAIALPSFKKARDQAREKSCINNMRLLSAAVDQYAIENDLSSPDTVPASEAALYMKGDAIPTCPSGGGYGDPFTVDADLTCTANDATTHNVNDQL